MPIGQIWVLWCLSSHLGKAVWNRDLLHHWRRHGICRFCSHCAPETHCISNVKTRVVRGVIFPPIHVICATYLWLTIQYILRNIHIKKVFHPLTLANNLLLQKLWTTLQNLPMVITLLIVWCFCSILALIVICYNFAIQVSVTEPRHVKICCLVFTCGQGPMHFVPFILHLTNIPLSCLCMGRTRKEQGQNLYSVLTLTRSMAVEDRSQQYTYKPGSLEWKTKSHKIYMLSQE